VWIANSVVMATRRTTSGVDEPSPRAMSRARSLNNRRIDRTEATAATAVSSTRSPAGPRLRSRVVPEARRAASRTSTALHAAALTIAPDRPSRVIANSEIVAPSPLTPSTARFVQTFVANRDLSCVSRTHHSRRVAIGERTRRRTVPPCPWRWLIHSTRSQAAFLFLATMRAATSSNSVAGASWSAATSRWQLTRRPPLSARRAPCVLAHERDERKGGAAPPRPLRQNRVNRTGLGLRIAPRDGGRHSRPSDQGYGELQR
jgi:hypothetical protein